MEDTGQKFTPQFLDNLKPQFLGLPEHLARELANMVYKILGKTLIEAVAEDASESDRYKNRNALEAFVNCTLFRIKNLRKGRDFSAYIASGDQIEISSKWRPHIEGDSLDVWPSSSQHDLEDRWNRLKTSIDSFEIPTIVENVFGELGERDRIILFKTIGIYGYEETPVRLIADELHLSRERVYQIVKGYELRTRRSMVLSVRRHRIADIVHLMLSGERNEFKCRPEVLLVASLVALGRLCQDSRIALVTMLDYLSERFPSESKLVKRLMPQIKSTEDYCQILISFEDRIVSQEAVERQRQIVDRQRQVVEDAALIKRLEGVAVSSLPLPSRTIFVLTKAGIESADELARLTIDELYHMPNLGRNSLAAILDFFKLYRY